jgi:erythronate-4-phosphate dehydrogenase
MNIFADENIPLVCESFAQFGNVTTFNGRQLTADHLNDADILLVRSVTTVNEQLLKKSKIKFVGSATIGFDHVDLNYLQTQHIGFARAPASNAVSAAEYVIAALFSLAQTQFFDLTQKTVGIIGCGNVGSRVLKRLQALGVKCLINDPPLEQLSNKNFSFSTLKDILNCDIISLHVPLILNGEYPTFELVNDTFLSELKNNAILINTSRGKVVDETALLKHAERLNLVLDVWRNEPNINQTLLEKTCLATPHIAGYSFDGKIRGTTMIYEACCEYFNVEKKWTANLPKPPIEKIVFSDQISKEKALRLAISACYDIRADDAKLRHIKNQTDSNKYFDQLRKNYPIRREFSTLQIETQCLDFTKKLSGLGFQIQ